MARRIRATAGFFARFPCRLRARLRPVARRLIRTCSRELLSRRVILPVVMLLVLGRGAVCSPLVGRDFFPQIDAGLIQLHVRAPARTRIEDTEQIFQDVEDKIREVIPDKDRQLILDNIGLPARTYNLAFTDGSTIGVNDGVILVSLKEGHAPTADYVQKLRQVLPQAFPGDTFYFQPPTW